MKWMVMAALLAAAPVSAQVLPIETRDGRWVTERVWNGDQTDSGLNLVEPVWLRVTKNRYR